MKLTVVLIALVGLAATSILLAVIFDQNNIDFDSANGSANLLKANSGQETNNLTAATTSPSVVVEEITVEPLANPPAIIKSVYFTKYSAVYPPRLKKLAEWASQGIINAVVIDFKDYSGHLSYESKIPLVKANNLSEPVIKDTKKLIKYLHDNNIYVMARVSVFQDVALVEKRPDLSVFDKVTNEPWRDRKQLTWLDPSIKENWDYIVAIAKELREDGIDEINFDYIRFPSDGIISNIVFKEQASNIKAEVIASFVKYLQSELKGVPISFDIFGQTTVNFNDVNIGQRFENFIVDGAIIAPMVYPSHYVKGFIGFENPGAQPYEVIKYSLDSARDRLDAFINFKKTTQFPNRDYVNASATPDIVPIFEEVSYPNKDIKIKIRPWIQYFDLGATYDSAMIDKEIKATLDSLASTTYYGGYHFWDPKNEYRNIELLTNR